MSAKSAQPAGKGNRWPCPDCCRRSTLIERSLGQGAREVGCERLAGKLLYPVTWESGNVWICHSLCL